MLFLQLGSVKHFILWIQAFVDRCNVTTELRDRLGESPHSVSLFTAASSEVCDTGGDKLSPGSIESKNPLCFLCCVVCTVRGSVIRAMTGRGTDNFSACNRYFLAIFPQYKTLRYRVHKRSRVGRNLVPGPPMSWLHRTKLFSGTTSEAGMLKNIALNMNLLHCTV